MNTAPNLPEPTLFERKLENTLELLRGILKLTKKIFML